MPRYKLTIEYDGSPFAGWQRQADQPSVQQVLEEAIEKFCGDVLSVQAAGRTDAGVHALGQVVHADLSAGHDPFRISEALNYHVRPWPVSILAVEPVDTSFEARFSATARHYEYRILNRRPPPALDAHRVWHVVHPLDADRMHAAAQHLIGLHDFTTFRAAACQAKSPVKTLDRIEVTRQGDEVILRASARSFLHHQVRSITGSLKLVGAGKWTATDLKAALEARDRARCGAMAPSSGLYLVKVDY